MFSKVLVAEDFDGYSIAVTEALKKLDIAEVSHASYCDDALMWLRKAIGEGNPYDLLVTDLSFKPDGRKSQLETGFDLIHEARLRDPNLSILVYSIENRVHPVRELFDNHGIAGYVLKGRNNIPELQKAIVRIGEGYRYVSAELSHCLTDRALEEIGVYDIELMQRLARGLSVQQVAADFRQHDIHPCGQSSIEKRLNKLRDILGAQNNVHLVVLAKDMGLL